MQGMSQADSLRAGGFDAGSTHVFRTAAYLHAEAVVGNVHESELACSRKEIIDITLAIARNGSAKDGDRLKACAMLGRWAGLDRQAGLEPSGLPAPADAGLDSLLSLVPTQAEVVE